ncbi:hypothetical protein [Streptomyces sp. ME19-01-6]|uniref:hypothetical protein n=1 Tax=Streptomyces sp. ME19-01-6 TaxID=3028686 RepID=UPI0029AE99A7|nr:hypothetical protein [Streptomyces sp. ME19-01-6]MDX3230074.1 hypothetical protein [Streptomyces sp. ME19-01-6]
MTCSSGEALLHKPSELLATDDFDRFFTARKTALLRSISAAMGKAILDEESPSGDPGISLDVADDTDDM